jgi:copper chaperone
MDAYRIEGMKCGGCVRSIRAALAAAAPEALLEADVGAREIRISAARDPQAARRAVEAAGFALEPLGRTAAAG